MVNQVSKLEEYPLPRVHDLFATLSGGELAKGEAGHEPCLLLIEDSKEFVTINTSVNICRSIMAHIWP